MAHEKLTSKTIAHLVRRGHGAMIDPNRLKPGHQLMLAARGVEYHDALLKAKTLDHDAKFVIATFGSERHHAALKKNHELDKDTKDVLRGKKPNEKSHVAQKSDNNVQQRFHEVKRRYFETKSAINTGEY